MLRSLFIVGALILLAGCGGNDSAVGGVSQGEADALNNAAAMLDAPPATGSIATTPQTQQKR